jgi:hypothetical protein
MPRSANRKLANDAARPAREIFCESCHAGAQWVFNGKMNLFEMNIWDMMMIADERVGPSNTNAHPTLAGDSRLPPGWVSLSNRPRRKKLSYF